MVDQGHGTLFPLCATPLPRARQHVDVAQAPRVRFPRTPQVMGRDPAQRTRVEEITSDQWIREGSWVELAGWKAGTCSRRGGEIAPVC